MTSIRRLDDELRADEPIVCERATPERMHDALGLLLTGQVRGANAAVEQFLIYARGQKLSLRELFVARAGETLLASTLIVPSPGRTAMVFLSALRDRAAGEAAKRLLQAASRAQRPDELRLIQALLEPGQRTEAGALRDAGFRDLATLVYMQRRTKRGGREARSWDGGVEAVPWGEPRRKLFEQAILASYEQTLDCPGLLGLRSIEDVITGHQGTGVFRPDLWLALHREGEPVAVMLLNLSAPRDTVELVYLGVSLAWRGRGIARRLVETGLSLGHRHGAARMMLAVDQSNTPAVRLYRSLGFTSDAHKHAMVLTLP